MLSVKFDNEDVLTDPKILNELNKQHKIKRTSETNCRSVKLRRCDISKHEFLMSFKFSWKEDHHDYSLSNMDKTGIIKNILRNSLDKYLDKNDKTTDDFLKEFTLDDIKEKINNIQDFKNYETPDRKYDIGIRHYESEPKSYIYIVCYSKKWS